jgi:hypothetical protein
MGWLMGIMYRLPPASTSPSIQGSITIIRGFHVVLHFLPCKVGLITPTGLLHALILWFIRQDGPKLLVSLHRGEQWFWVLMLIRSFDRVHILGKLTVEDMGMVIKRTNTIRTVAGFISTMESPASSCSIVMSNKSIYFVCYSHDSNCYPSSISHLCSCAFTQTVSLVSI